MLSVVLSAHTVLIAAVLIPYTILMGVLSAYIYRTSRYRDRTGPDEDTGATDLRPLRAAA